MAADQKDHSFRIHWSWVLLGTSFIPFFITYILYGKMIWIYIKDGEG